MQTALGNTIILNILSYQRITPGISISTYHDLLLKFRGLQILLRYYNILEVK